MLYAYADQNFLSFCLDRPEWVTKLAEAKKSAYASLVLSPVHFYEFGNARDDLKEKLLCLVERLEPTWAYSPTEQQLLEAISLWHQAWGVKIAKFEPLCSLADVLAAMHRKPVELFTAANIRQVVGAFQGLALRELKQSMRLQETACTQNQLLFKQHRFTKRLLNRIDAEHVAVQLARWVDDQDPREVLERAHDLLRNKQTSTYIEVLLYWQLHKALRCYEVETHMSEKLWSGTAKLGVHNFVDRMHALVALPFCDFFVTNDIDLGKRCEHVRSRAKCRIAEVLTPADYIARLDSKCEE